MSQTKLIQPSTVHDYIMTHLDDVSPVETWGEKSFFYNPGQMLSRGTYFATIKPKDSVNDNASQLDRPGLWRLNMGVRKGTYFELFGPPPERPGKGGDRGGRLGFHHAQHDHTPPCLWLDVVDRCHQPHWRNMGKVLHPYRRCPCARREKVQTTGQTEDVKPKQSSWRAFVRSPSASAIGRHFGKGRSGRLELGHATWAGLTNASGVDNRAQSQNSAP